MHQLDKQKFLCMRTQKIRNDMNKSRATYFLLLNEFFTQGHLHKLSMQYFY